MIYIAYIQYIQSSQNSGKALVLTSSDKLHSLCRQPLQVHGCRATWFVCMSIGHFYSFDKIIILTQEPN